MSALSIREEQAPDESDIRALTEWAFSGMPYAGGDEQDVVDRLRSSGSLTLSLVATLDNEVVGQITFSPAIVEDGSSPWFALGPVSVAPTHQRQGIGSALIEEGVGRIEAMGALGCILTGNPDYYSRFGFNLSPSNTPVNEPEEYFQLKLLGGELPSGRFTFDSAFYEDH